MEPAPHGRHDAAPVYKERDEVRIRKGQRRVEDHRDAIEPVPGLEHPRVQARGERGHEHLALLVCFFEFQIRTDRF